MKPWWENTEKATAEGPTFRAVAYYRHSAQDRQENSIPLQREQVHEWAEQHGVEIIEEFSDHGKSGLNAEGRPAFNEMMNDWVKQRRDFQYILCLDVSRWGRFQDIDLSATFSAECKRHGKEVIYTSIGKPKEDDPLYPVYVQFERFRAAQYSRELSDKVKRGCRMIAGQGYWAGGPPPYGMQRLLLDEQREPLNVLEPGQRKGIQNQRVTLVGGPPEKATVIQRIFHEFVDLNYSEFLIAENLNNENIPSPSGGRRGAETVRDRLRNEKYAGTMVYDKTTQKLKTPRRNNPPENWVRTPEAFEGIISHELFERAQQILEQRRKKYDPDDMLRKLDSLYKTQGLWHQSLLRLDPEIPSAGTYSRQFGSLDTAFQNLFSQERTRARESVQEQIKAYATDILPYDDFLVLDQKLTISLQPAVPIPQGYSCYWPFYRDPRQVIDITLGVVLSTPPNCEIQGYITLPRWIRGHNKFRLTATSCRAELLGRYDLKFLRQLLA